MFGAKARIAVFIGAALLVAVLVGGVALAASRGATQPAKQAAFTPSTSTSPGSASSPSSQAASATNSPPATPSQPATPSPLATASAGGQPTAAPTNNSQPPPPPAPPAYSFQPPVSATGAQPATSFVAADLVMAGQMVVASFHVATPGAVSVHAFAGITGLSACIGVAGGACTPAGVPNPAFWTLSADDLAHASDYQIQVPLSGGGLAGLDFAWNGPRDAHLAGIRMTSSCSALSGYAAGCGLRFRVQAISSMSVTAGQGDLHLKVRDKALAGTSPFDHRLPVTAAFGLPAAGSWTGYLYPEAGPPGYLVTVAVSWA